MQPADEANEVEAVVVAGNGDGPLGDGREADDARLGIPLLHQERRSRVRLLWLASPRLFRVLHVLVLELGGGAGVAAEVNAAKRQAGGHQKWQTIKTNLPTQEHSLADLELFWFCQNGAS